MIPDRHTRPRLGRFEQAMPFARPTFADIPNALDHVVAKHYPARGAVIGPFYPMQAA
jgi:hypothetical protein